MVSIQQISLNNQAIITNRNNPTELILYHHRLKTYFSDILIERVSQESFNRLLTGRNENTYFLTNSCHPNHRVLIQIFKNLPNVNNLNMSANYIIYFPHEILPPSVESLDLSKNQIRDLPQVAPNLKRLNYSENMIKAIPDQLPVHLEELKVSYNPISSLPNILPTTLKVLDIAATKITRLPDNFQELRQLENLCIDHNPQLVISERLLNFMEEIFENRRRVEEAERLRRMQEDEQRRADLQRAYQQGANRPIPVPEQRDIYNDGQNVHDSHINNEVAKNVEYLIEKAKTILEEKSKSKSKTWYDIGGFFTDKKAEQAEAYYKYLKNFPFKNKQILEYLYALEDTKFRAREVSEIICAYFTYVDTFEEEKRKDILSILDEDLAEMRYVCVTGRIARLINTLTGQDDNIAVKISDNAQIQAKYNLVSGKYINESDMIKNIYQCWEFRSLLMEVNIKQDMMQVWLEPFIESLKETYKETIVLIEQSIQEDMRIIETIEYLRLNTEKKLTDKEFLEISNLLRDDVKLTGLSIYLQTKIKLEIGDEKFQELDGRLGYRTKLTTTQIDDKVKIRGHLSDEDYPLCLAWIKKEISK